MDSKELTQDAGAFPARAKNYIEDLKKEIRLVTWPSWTQVRATTGVVIAAVFLFAAYFFVVDFIVSRSITALFAKLTH